MSARKSREIWRDIPGFPGYQVSNRGRVRSFWKGGCKPFVSKEPQRFLKHWTNKKNYRGVALRISAGKLNYRPIHLLVLAAFRGQRPTGMLCRHLDSNKKNNCPENLAWGTQSQNTRDMFIAGDFPKQKLNPRKVKEIRKMIRRGTVKREIARAFGVSPTVISDIANGRIWTFV